VCHESRVPKMPKAGFSIQSTSKSPVFLVTSNPGAAAAADGHRDRLARPSRSARRAYAGRSTICPSFIVIEACLGTRGRGGGAPSGAMMNLTFDFRNERSDGEDVGRLARDCDRCYEQGLIAFIVLLTIILVVDKRNTAAQCMNSPSSLS
jgi:hypothetical protein